MSPAFFFAAPCRDVADGDHRQAISFVGKIAGVVAVLVLAILALVLT